MADVEQVAEKMAQYEESVEDVVEKQDESTVEYQDEPEYSAIELKAMEKGWNPDKEAVPEGKEWIDAGEFLRNESFFTEIHKLKRELNSTKKSFEVLKEHHKKVAEVSKKEALEELKRLKKAALEDDDHDTVIEIDDKILDIKSQKDDPVEMQEGDNNIFEEWVERNSWYDTDPEMRQFADEIGAGYVARNNTAGKPLDLQKVYKHVEDKVKQMYKDKFVPIPKKRVRPSVEGAASSRGSQGKSKSKFTERDLSDEQRTVMNRFVKTGALTKQEYIDELVKIGELG